MGKDSTGAPTDGEQVPGMRARSAAGRRSLGHRLPACGGRLEMQTTPERVSNPQNAYGMSKLGQEMVAINLGRRYGIPQWRCATASSRGPRQSLYNA